MTHTPDKVFIQPTLVTTLPETLVSSPNTAWPAKHHQAVPPQHLTTTKPISRALQKSYNPTSLTVYILVEDSIRKFSKKRQ